jgi:hypothetical protein
MIVRNGGRLKPINYFDARRAKNKRRKETSATLVSEFRLDQVRLTESVLFSIFLHPSARLSFPSKFHLRLAVMDEFNSETDSDYASYWRDWVCPAKFPRVLFIFSILSYTTRVYGEVKKGCLITHRARFVMPVDRHVRLSAMRSFSRACTDVPRAFAGAVVAAIAKLSRRRLHPRRLQLMCSFFSGQASRLPDHEPHARPPRSQWIGKD